MKPLTLIDKAFLLKHTPLFSMLDLDLLLVISDKLGTIETDAGDYIFAAGEPALRLYFIVEGKVDILDEKNKMLAQLQTPDFFGDEALLSDQLRGYTAVSKTDVLLLTLSKPNLLAIISECPQVAIGLLQAYTSYNIFRSRKENAL